jgi:hypothetical protein
LTRSGHAAIRNLEAIHIPTMYLIARAKNMKKKASQRLLIFLIALGAAELFSVAAYAQSNYPFVDDGFEVPEQLVTEDIRLRMLTVNDVVKDFDAVISSAEYLGEIWPESDWPKGLTLEQNLIDLGWHQGEFQNRTSFAYTVVTHDESKVVGCVYIYPSRKRGYDAEVYLWAREAALGSPPDSQLFEAVAEWMPAKWPFQNVAFPGREIDWDSWNAIPDEKR